MHKTYELFCQLSPEAASERIERLLSEEGVKYATAELSVASTKTPIVLLSVQPRLYTRRNWVGVNPFVFVTSVAVRCEPIEGGGTRVTIRANRRRAFLLVAFWAACSALAALAIPEPGRAILILGVSCAAWLGIASFLGGYLVSKEIGDRLEDE
jgi:hypothetical protein